MYASSDAARPLELPDNSGVDYRVPSYVICRERGKKGADLMLRLLLFLVLPGLLRADPVSAMECFIDAVYRNDAEAVFGMLSEESRASITMTLAMAKLQPVNAAEQLSRRTGRPVNGQELSCWTETDFVEVILEAPALSAMLPARDTIICSVSDMKGDTAVVSCRVALPSGGSEEARFALVMQRGEWRVGETFL